MGLEFYILKNRAHPIKWQYKERECYTQSTHFASKWGHQENIKARVIIRSGHH